MAEWNVYGRDVKFRRGSDRFFLVSQISFGINSMRGSDEMIGSHTRTALDACDVDRK